jgi:flagellin-specific chaperone FliS
MNQVTETENPLYAAIIAKIVEDSDFLKTCESLDCCEMLNDIALQDELDHQLSDFVSQNLESFESYVRDRLLQLNIEELERLVDEKEIRNTF